MAAPLPRGLRPHTHDERMAVARGLVPLLERRFGDGLRAVATSGSVARGDDRAYSDLELVVFLRDPPPADEDSCLQRIVDGMLVEAEYLTEEAYVARWATLSPTWYLSASERLSAVHNPALVEGIVRRVRAIRHPRAPFLAQAAHRFREAQEAFGKALNALEGGHREAIGLLLWDAVHHSLVTLSFLNERPFTTFSRFIPEARAFPFSPPGYHELLDRMVDGRWDEDRTGMRDLLLGVFSGFEARFEAEGVALYDDSLDPARPNRRYR